MRHHADKPASRFVIEPAEFNKYTDPELLRYCLGATMYMPGYKDFLEPLLTRKYPGLTSIVLCFEDACREDMVKEAEKNAIKLLDDLNEEIAKGNISYDELPLIIFRVRNIGQFRHFASNLKKEHIRLVTAFNFPKFNKENGNAYFEYLEELNERFGEIIYGMPILESKEMAYLETRKEELLGVKEILDRYRKYVLNVRVGGT
ncbi:MAG: HpcH/HpaI aldolase/citrate lyase family protein, partial [Erysipelotrichaceae bacterium]|nr:HpcH/HpaI aldolase/citrate lyase family protein [Erysipelotrichaceae bacterium]